jgi:hypothetical protein
MSSPSCARYLLLSSLLTVRDTKDISIEKKPGALRIMAVGDSRTVKYMMAIKR